MWTEEDDVSEEIHHDIVEKFAKTLNFLSKEYPDEDIGFYIDKMNEQWKKNTEVWK